MDNPSHFMLQRWDLRLAHTKGLVPATSPGDQVPSCELPIFIKKFSRRDQKLVPATCPTNSNHVWIHGISPCDQMKINQLLISIFAPITPYELRFKMAANSEVEQVF